MAASLFTVIRRPLPIVRNAATDELAPLTTEEWGPQNALLGLSVWSGSLTAFRQAHANQDS